ncbi:MAG TPA: PAS domain-containing protein, partial [Alphaproteobacteria bacterium]|nr:PAS domain-containing protein [Alphaproteobacteria bacterium]
MDTRRNHAPETPAFLAGGGVMGDLIRAYDWSSTPLGPPQTWPAPLRTAVGLLLGARQPVYVAWGRELTSLYNDGYLPIVGAKHPEGLGQPFRSLWAEIWETFRPIVEATMAGEAQHFVDMPIALSGRPGLPEGYFTFSYTPLRDEAGEIAGFYCAATETTDKVVAERRRADEAARQRKLLDQAPAFVITMQGPDHVVEFVNHAHRALFGSDDWAGKAIREAFPDVSGQGFFELLDRVYATGETYRALAAPVRYRIPPDGYEETRYFNFIYAPIFGDDNEITGIFCEGFDVTEAHLAQAALRESETRLRHIIDSAREYAIITLDRQGRITTWNRGA